MSRKVELLDYKVRLFSHRKKKDYILQQKRKGDKQNYEMVKQKISTEYLRCVLIEMEYSTPCSQQKPTV